MRVTVIMLTLGIPITVFELFTIKNEIKCVEYSIERVVCGGGAYMVVSLP